MRRLTCLVLLFAAIVPSCSKKSSSNSPPPVEFTIYFVRQAYLARAFVSLGNWNFGEFVDSNLSAWAAIPGKSITGTTVTFPYGIRFVAYIKAGLIYRHDVAGGANSPICTEASADTIVALIDTDPVATSSSTTYVVYTTTPVAGLMNLKVARLVGPGSSTPATLETGISSSLGVSVRVPRNAADIFYYTLTGATTTVKRAVLTAYPAAAIDVMSGADDAVSLLVKDSSRVIYRRATGEIMKADAAALPATVLYTPPANTTAQVMGKIDLAADSEVFITTHLDTNADTIPDQVTLRRVMYSSGATTTFAGPFSYAALPLNRVVFTGSRVIWQLIYDTTSFITSYDRVTPGAGTSLLTGGRSLAPNASLYVINDALGYRVLFTETVGPTTLRVTKAESGALVNEYTFTGAPGATDAINHMGSLYFDATLDLAVAAGTARFVFVDGTSLRSILVDMSPATAATIGAMPADIGQFVLVTSYRGPTCLEGITLAPAANDIFFYHAAGASLLRQTASPEDESALGAQ